MYSMISKCPEATKPYSNLMFGARRDTNNQQSLRSAKKSTKQYHLIYIQKIKFKENKRKLTLFFLRFLWYLLLCFCQKDRIHTLEYTFGNNKKKILSKS